MSRRLLQQPGCPPYENDEEPEYGMNQSKHQHLPEIDVLITVFNGERFIGQTIQSVLDQTFANWRLIIVDDQSTDQTAHIIADFAAKDSRIKLVKGNHQGIAAAANRGLQEVCAPFVARLDADDIAIPDRLATQLEFLRQNPTVVATGSDVQLIDTDNKTLRRRHMPERPESIREKLKTRNCIIHPSSMLRTSALQQIGGYREKFRNSEDYDLWLRLSEIGDLTNLPQCLTLYRRHPTQITASNNTRRLTIYSVAAAIDHFLRRYGLADRQCQIDEKQPDDIAEKLILLYDTQEHTIDFSALNRHAIRFLRYVDGLSPTQRTRLLTATKRNLSTLESLKLRLYSMKQILSPKAH